MAQQSNHADALGRAWAHHRQGRNAEAAREFDAILVIEPHNVDALYGLGLAQRSGGNKDGARASLQSCLQHVERLLVEHPGEDRYEMLQRMCQQRLAELDLLK